MLFALAFTAFFCLALGFNLAFAATLFAWGEN
jgi:hypothetical protein